MPVNVWRVAGLDDSRRTAILQDNHIYTSGATGTNAAVIRGALRAEKPDLLTVVLPQSRSKQPPESQELLEEVCDAMLLPWRSNSPPLRNSHASSGYCIISGMQAFPTLTSARALMGLQYSWRLSVSVLLRH